MFGYERLVKPQQSFSVNIGLVNLPLPEIKDGQGNVAYSAVGKNTGWSAFGDYRFYFGDLNRFDAPRGAYLAPYAGYYRFDAAVDFGFETDSGVDEVGVEAGIDVVNLGVQFGYQFVFYERFTLDLVLFGPSLSLYLVELEASGSLSDEITESDAYEAFVEKATDIFPAASGFFESGTLSEKGLNTAWGPGFRYLIQVGYRF